MKSRSLIFKPNKGSLIRAIIAVPFLIFALFAVLKAKTALQKKATAPQTERKARAQFDLKKDGASQAGGKNPQKSP